MTDINLIPKAIDIAKEAHAGMTRKWAKDDEGNPIPYIKHPGRVAHRITMLPGVPDTLIAAAWLHDVLEDTKMPAKRIVDECGIEVFYLIYELTNISKMFDGAPREQKKLIDRFHIMKISEEARIIKMADRTDNLLDLAQHESPLDFMMKYHRESCSLLGALIQRKSIALSSWWNILEVSYEAALISVAQSHSLRNVKQN